jgi:integrase
MDITELIALNRKPLPQVGQKVETPTAWYLRYYTTEVYTQGKSKGKRKQKLVWLVPKNDNYRSWADVEPIIRRVLDEVNAGREYVNGDIGLTDFIEKHYLPWCESNKSAPTANGYRRVWENYWKPHVGKAKLTGLQRHQVTAVLTGHATAGKSGRTLSHIKWFLSGVYVFASAQGIVSKNPVHTDKSNTAKWLVKIKRTKKQTVYSLETVLTMLRILEPLDIRAAVAVGFAYFAALRPAEIRGLRWDDYEDGVLQVRRSVWRSIIGETKTEGSERSVRVIEPLRGLLKKLWKQSPVGYILQSDTGKPLSLDSLNFRLIAPAMKKAGIEWDGYYPCRRGSSSLLTSLTQNVLIASAHLGHSNAVTTLKHYTQASADEIDKGLTLFEKRALELMAKAETETVQ